jgi:YD repeat-containing protein
MKNLIFALFTIVLYNVNAQITTKYYKSISEYPSDNLNNPYSIKPLDELFNLDTLDYSYRISCLGSKIIGYKSNLCHNWPNEGECMDQEANYYLDQEGKYKFCVRHWYDTDTIYFELNPSGYIVQSKSKNGNEVFKYDINENIIEIIEGDSLKLRQNDLFSIKMKYDELNNRIETAKYNLAGKLINNDYIGAIQRYKYDSNHRIIERSYYNSQNKLVENTIAIVQYKYDLKGNLIEESYYNSDLKLTHLSLDNSSIKKWVYNDNNQLIEFSEYFDDLTLASQTDYIYFETKLVEKNKTSFSKKNDLYNPGAKSIVKEKYDSLGLVICEINLGYDSSNNVVSNTKYDRIRDEKGQIIEIRKYSNDELESNYPSIQKFKYDETGNLIERADYDKDNQLFTFFNTGEALERFKYDKNKNRIEKLSYGIDNELIEGVAIERTKFDSLNRVILTEYFNKNNQYELKYGYAIIRYVRDSIDLVSKNKINETYYYDANKELIEGKAIDRNVYDKEGRLIEISALDKENKLTTLSEYGNVAKIFKSYDVNNQIIEEKYYNIDDLLTNCNSYDFESEYRDLGECAIVRYNRDSVLTSKGYNSENELIKKIIYVNEWGGNFVEVINYQGENMINDANGVAKYVFAYDKNSIKIQEEHYDSNLNFIEKIKYTNADYYTLDKIEYFDEKNRPIMSKEGYSKYDLKTDTYFDTKGKEINNKDKSANQVSYIKSYGYDFNGNLIYLQYLSKKGKPIIGDEGYFMFDYTNYKYYDIKGREINMNE